MRLLEKNKPAINAGLFRNVSQVRNKAPRQLFSKFIFGQSELIMSSLLKVAIKNPKGYLVKYKLNRIKK